jgi:hypothetical protein
MREAYREDASIEKKPKRVVNPHERTKMSDLTPDGRQVEDDNSEVGEVPDQACEDMLEYWQEVLNILDEATDDDSEEYFDDVDGGDIPVVELFGSDDEVIPLPDRRPFPDFNAPNFFQERRMHGIRGDKYPLVLLFPQTTLGVMPYLPALTP